MNRRICSAMIGSLFVAVSVSAQTTWTSQSGLPVSPSAFSQPLSANAVADVLSERVDSVDWVDRTFEEVIQWVRERGDARINIVPRWNHLGVEGISRDSLVTLQLNNTNVADVLNEALVQLSDSDEVRYRGLRNKLTISTRADFERKLHTKVYDVTDILFQVPDFGQGAPLIDLKRAAASGGGGGGGGGQTVFGGGGGQGQEQIVGGEQAEQELEERLTKLRQLIEQSIEPQSWDLSGTPGQAGGGAAGTGGGGRGRIRIFNRSLVVTNTIEIHEQIAGFFSMGR